MSEDTIFSKIIRKEIPADLVFESDKIIAFRDINPQAPTHILIIPKEPIEDLQHSEDSHQELLGELLLTARDIAKAEGIEQEGFRLVINSGDVAEISHLHLHLLSGREFNWPPG